VHSGSAAEPRARDRVGAGVRAAGLDPEPQRPQPLRQLRPPREGRWAVFSTPAISHWADTKYILVLSDAHHCSEKGVRVAQQNDAGRPTHPCGNATTKGCSWPNFRADTASFSPAAAAPAPRPWPAPTVRGRCGRSGPSEKGVRLAQKMQVGPCILVGGIQLRKAEVGPTSGPTWHISH
jgi:hypothetical protein